MSDIGRFLDCPPVTVCGRSSPTAGNGMTPEALYELKLDTVRKFINHIHANGCFIAPGYDFEKTVDLTKLTLDFVGGETK